MNQMTYSFKHQLEDQPADLERQYKIRIVTLDKAIVEKDKEVGKLSSSLSRSKSEIKDFRKALSSIKKIIDNITFAKIKQLWLIMEKFVLLILTA